MELNEMLQSVCPPSITVKIKDQYGQQTIVPVCRAAQIFAEIAGTKTLTSKTIQTIKALGYEVKVQQAEVAL